MALAALFSSLLESGNLFLALHQFFAVLNLLSSSKFETSSYENDFDASAECSVLLIRVNSRAIRISSLVHSILPSKPGRQKEIEKRERKQIQRSMGVEPAKSSGA